MRAHIAGALALAALVGALFCLPASAQDAVRVLPEPDALVRGTGVAGLGNPDGQTNALTPALFRIDVARLPLNFEPLRGGFYISEVPPPAATNFQRSVMIVSRKVTSLEIQGNKAIIRAQGTYNGRAACLTLEVLDDNGSGDWLSIRADGCMLDVIYYNKAGGVKQGDIRVWEKPPVAGYAKGFGSINVPKPDRNLGNTGNFEFVAENTSTGVWGKLVFREIDPRMMGPIERPIVTITMTTLKDLNVVGNQAWLYGEGTMNERKVNIWAGAQDNNAPWIRPGPLPLTMLSWLPDRFSIAVNDPLMPSLLPLYFASGPLMRGDIAVGRYSITPILSSVPSQ